MNTDYAHVDASSTFNTQEGAASDARVNPKRMGWVQQAVSTIAAAPATVDGLIKAHPYKSVGIACVVGAGLGACAFMGSRVLRAMAIAAASFVAVELARTYFRWDATRAVPNKSKANGAASETVIAN